jgi:hypothetical protein
LFHPPTPSSALSAAWSHATIHVDDGFRWVVDQG